jgi:hypothetical protein
MEGAEWTKVKYTHSRDTSDNPLKMTLELITKDRTIK